MLETRIKGMVKMIKAIRFLFVLVLFLGLLPKAYSDGFISVSDAPSTPAAKTLYKDNIISAWVNFDGTSCTGGSGNECTINSEFNVEKVVRISTGLYEIYWDTDFSSINYVVSGTGRSIFIELGVLSTNKVEIVTDHHSTLNRLDAVSVNVMAIGPQ